MKSLGRGTVAGSQNGRPDAAPCKGKKILADALRAALWHSPTKKARIEGKVADNAYICTLRLSPRPLIGLGTERGIPRTERSNLDTERSNPRTERGNLDTERWLTGPAMHA